MHDRTSASSERDWNENYSKMQDWKLQKPEILKVEERERERKGWKSSCKVYRVYTEATYLIDGYGFVGLDGKRLVWRKWIRPVVSLIWSWVQFQLNIMFENMRLFGKLAGFLLKDYYYYLSINTKYLMWYNYTNIQLTFFANFTGTFFFVYEIIVFWTSNG